jgi:arylsulfatase A-like enzyme
MSCASNDQPSEYEMFIPFLYRGKDKESTERRVFWVFKQLNWGYIQEVRVFGFDDESKKNVTAVVRYRNINPRASELIAQLDAGETAQVHYEEGKPWFWNVVKYERRAPKPKPQQVTYKIKPKADDVKPKATDVKPKTTAPENKPSDAKPRPSTPTTEPPAAAFKPQVISVKNKFKPLRVESPATSSSESEESK